MVSNTLTEAKHLNIVLVVSTRAGINFFSFQSASNEEPDSKYGIYKQASSAPYGTKRSPIPGLWPCREVKTNRRYASDDQRVTVCQSLNPNPEILHPSHNEKAPVLLRICIKKGRRMLVELQLPHIVVFVLLMMTLPFRRSIRIIIIGLSSIMLILVVISTFRVVLGSTRFWPMRTLFMRIAVLMVIIINLRVIHVSNTIRFRRLLAGFGILRNALEFVNLISHHARKMIYLMIIIAIVIPSFFALLLLLLLFPVLLLFSLSSLCFLLFLLNC
jgi:hypothetical protein